MGLIDDLKPGPVALDTQVFIYFIEEGKQQPIKLDFFINLKSAKQIGLTIPRSMLYRADRVIK